MTRGSRPPRGAPGHERESDREGKSGRGSARDGRAPTKSRSSPRPKAAAPKGAGPKAGAPKERAAPEEPMRIQRALARAGVASRRHAEELVAAGRVHVNGRVATTGQSVRPTADEITVDGTRIAAPATRAEWIVLNKPAGVMTTREDPQGRPTVFGLVPSHRGLTYVGRLDLLTQGVLLLTTDGDAAHLLTHPSTGVERTYVAQVRGDADLAVERLLDEGVELEDGPVTVRAARARHLGRGRWEFEVTLAEGRNREVRRLCEALDLRVDKLTRTQFGPVRLGELAPGASRALLPREREALERLLRRPPKGRKTARG